MKTILENCVRSWNFPYDTVKYFSLIITWRYTGFASLHQATILQCWLGIKDSGWCLIICHIFFLCSINANGTYKTSQPQYYTAYLGKYILEHALNFQDILEIVLSLSITGSLWSQSTMHARGKLVCVSPNDILSHPPKCLRKCLEHNPCFGDLSLPTNKQTKPNSQTKSSRPLNDYTSSTRKSKK